MGLFKKDKSIVPYEVARSQLKPKDNHVHVMMLNTWSTWSTLTFKCDEEYIEEVNAVIAGMQEDGYEIVGIQHNSISNGSGLGMWHLRRSSPIDESGVFRIPNRIFLPGAVGGLLDDYYKGGQ